MGNGKSLSIGVKRLADKLHKLSSAARTDVQKAIVETTLEAHEFIVDKITHHIAPHSGESRQRNPQATVTDLVDTGAYRASWTVDYPSAYSGRLSTNSEYALDLEYGFDGEVQVPAHQRKLTKGPNAGKSVNVSAHSRHQHSIPFYVARGTALKMAPIFQKRIRAIVEGALK